MVMKRSTSSLMRIWRSISLSAVGRGIDVHQRVVGLAVLVDAVGEGLQSPVLDPADLPPLLSITPLYCSTRASTCCCVQILPGKKYMFIKSHCYCLSSFLYPDPGG